MALFREFTDAEQVFWDQYSEYSYKYMRLELARMLGVQPKRISKNLLCEYFYRAGVKPNEFLISRPRARYPQDYSHRDWEFEIRFAGPEVVSLLRLSGLIK